MLNPRLIAIGAWLGCLLALAVSGCAVNDSVQEPVSPAVQPVTCSGADVDDLDRVALQNLLAGRLVDAERAGALVVERREKCGESEDLAASVGRLGLIHLKRGDLDAAAPLLDRSLRLFQAHASPGSPDLARAQLNAGLVSFHRADYRAAEAMFRRALALTPSGADLDDRARALDHLGLVLSRQGKFEEALRHSEEAVKRYEIRHGPIHLALADGLENLGIVLGGAGRHPESERARKRSLQIREVLLGERNIDTARAREAWAVALESLGRSDEAQVQFAKALADMEQAAGRSSLAASLVQNNYGAFLARRGKLREAEPLFRTALATRRSVLGPGHPDTIGTSRNLALCLELQGRKDEAKQFAVP